MLSRFIGLNMDFAGAIASFICAVHCAAAPLLISIGLTSGHDHNHIFDWVFLSVGLLIAAYALVGDYLKKHRILYPLLVGLSGFVILFIGIESHGDWPILNVLGGLMILTSHYFNYRLSHRKQKVITS